MSSGLVLEGRDTNPLLVTSFADLFVIDRSSSGLYLDGGNIVDNYAGRIVTTTRFLEDNGREAIEALFERSFG